MERAYLPLLELDGNIQGSAQVCLLVSEEGAVEDLKVVESSGDFAVDHAAVSTARAMKFRPAKAGDLPVRVWVAIPIYFKTR